jgi:hypothetical protein
MTDFAPLIKLVTRSKNFKGDCKKIDKMIKNEVRKELQKRIDQFLIDRTFIQINQE